MDLGLQGKGVLVTGGSRGIGRAIAVLCATEGANVAICARTEEHLTNTLDLLRNQGTKGVSHNLLHTVSMSLLERNRRKRNMVRYIHQSTKKGAKLRWMSKLYGN